MKCQRCNCEIQEPESEVCVACAWDLSGALDPRQEQEPTMEMLSDGAGVHWD